MASWFRKNKKVQEPTEQERLVSFLQRSMHECVYVELKCYYMQKEDLPTPVAHSACAVYPEPIPDKEDLLGLNVFPTFRYVNVDNIEILFIELEFPGRKFVLGSNDREAIIEFIETTKSLNYFVFTDNPLLTGGIKIPIVQAKVLTDILLQLSP